MVMAAILPAATFLLLHQAAGYSSTASIDVSAGQVFATKELRGANCGASSFPQPYNNIQVVGLQDAPAHAGRKNATDCMMTCCSFSACTAWQWSATGTRVSPSPIAACRIGSSVQKVFSSPGWVGGGATAAPPPSPAPPAPPPPAPTPPTPPALPKTLVSNTLGSHMVLQRAPAAAMIYGYSTAGSTVTTVLDNGPPFKATADAAGVWRQALPPTPADGKAHTIAVSSTASSSSSADTGVDADLSDVTMTDIVFGDVYLCGGQSNMAFAVDQMTNGTTTEAAIANNYSGLNGVRLFTVGQGTPFLNGSKPVDHLLSLEQQWVAASNTTVRDARPGLHDFTYFSAVCWIFGRTVHDGLGGKVPVGLVSSNWPGTRVEEWVQLTPAVQHCESGSVRNYLYNTMIHPYTIGPMALTGFTWYQGESNVGPVNARTGINDAAVTYSCTFTELIKGWRQAFNIPNAYFGFVQLSTWCGDVFGIPDMRGQIFPGSSTQGQMAALELPNVGYATNADHGMGCGIHPTWKQYVGERLGNSALGIQYKQTSIAWQSPYYASAKSVVGAPGVASVLVTLAEVGEKGLTTDVDPFNYKVFRGSRNCSVLGTIAVEGTCGWAALKVGGEWLNATITASDGHGSAGGKQLLLKVDASGVVTASAYAWAPIPLMNAYDVSSGLPVLPWNRSL